MSIVPSGPTGTESRPRHWPLFGVGVLLFVLGLPIYVVQFQLKHLFVPWYVPLMSTTGVLLMLASSVCSQISAEELTAIANFVQSDTYRPFETYTLVGIAYVLLSLLMRTGFWGLGLLLFPRRRRLGTPL